MGKAFVLDFADKLLRMVIHDGCTGRDDSRHHAHFHEIPVDFGGIAAVAVANQEPRVRPERTFTGSCPPFQGVDEPLRSAVISRSGNNHLLRFQMNEEQGKESPLAVIRPHFGGEEVPSPCHFLEFLYEVIPLYPLNGEDQTYVGYLYRTGRISKEEMKVHPKRHVLMNALGVFPTANMDIKIRDYSNESVLVCSDGLYNNVDEEEIANILKGDDSTNQKVHQLITLANVNGGSDNIAIALWEAQK